MRDYQESVTTRQINRRMDRQTLDKVIRMCRYAKQQEAQRATVAHLSTMNARKILEWNQKQEAQRAP